MLSQLGSTYLELEQTAAAEQALRAAVKLKPDDSSALWKLGRVLLHSGSKADGLRMMEQSRKLRSANLSAFRASGAAELLQLPPAERNARYIELLQRTADSRPTDPEVLLELGKRYLASGRIGEGRDALQKLLALEPGSAVVISAGRALANAGELDLAISFFRLRAGDDVSSAMALALATAQSGHSASALAQLEKVPDNARGADYRVTKALILDSAGRSEDAVAALDGDWSAADANLDVILGAARLLVSHGQNEKALSLLHSARPGPQIDLAAAWLYLQTGRIQRRK